MSILTKKEIKGDYMKEYSKWKDEEVIKLFKFIEDGKKTMFAFQNFLKTMQNLQTECQIVLGITIMQN